MGRLLAALVLAAVAMPAAGAPVRIFAVGHKQRLADAVTYQTYRDKMAEKGFTISGTSPDGALAELIELQDHPYFVACQYHPEFQSKPNKPHPLFKGFIAASHRHIHHKPI